MQIIASLLSLAVLTQAVSVPAATREIDMGHTDMFIVRTLYTIQPEGQTKFKFAIAKDFESTLIKISA